MTVPTTTTTTTMTPSPPAKPGETLSPQSMADAAIAQAVAERQSQGIMEEVDITMEVSGAPQEKRARLASATQQQPGNYVTPYKEKNDDVVIVNGTSSDNDKRHGDDDESLVEDEKLLQEAWKMPTSPKNSENNNNDADGTDDVSPEFLENALETTLVLLKDRIDTLVQCGLEAFHGLESSERKLEHSMQVAESSNREVTRLKASEEQSRVAISNLLKAVESNKSDTRDASRVASVEARLRGDMANLRSERDEALALAAQSKRKTNLLQEEVLLLKSKLTRMTQEKIKMERDSRAAVALAKSLDSHANSDCDFYKKKVAELNDHLQAQQALVAEQKHQMDEMRRQMERSMSQNRLATIRAEANNKMRGKNRGL